MRAKESGRHAGGRTIVIASPVHPIFTHFTIALTAASLVFDGIGRIWSVSSLADAGKWTIVFALPATVGALVSGVMSRRHLAMEEGVAREWMRAHVALGPTFFGVLLAVALWRISLWHGTAPVPWTYLLALSAVVALMTVQGHLGGELVYRFGAGVHARFRELPHRREPAGEPPRRVRAGMA